MRAFLFFSFLAAASTAHAAFVDGNRIQDWCESKSSLISGYVGGVVDQSRADAKAAFQEHGRASETSTAGGEAAVNIFNAIVGNACPPSDAIMKQFIDITCRYVDQHPEHRQKDGPELVRDALSEAWSCSK